MNIWFECKVKYEKIDEVTGKQICPTLPYLVEAVSCTDAEATVTNEMRSLVNGEFVIKSINESKISDVFYIDDPDWYYKIRVSFISIDESAGREKRVINSILLAAGDIEEALDKIKEGLSGMTVDYEIISISKSKIADVFVKNGK